MYDERMKSLRTDGLSPVYDGLWLMHSDLDFTSSPRQEKSKKAFSDSPTRPMSDGITIGASSTYDRLIMSMGTQKGGVSSFGLTSLLRTASDMSDMFAGVMTSPEGLRRDMTKKIDRVELRAQQG